MTVWEWIKDRWAAIGAVVIGALAILFWWKGKGKVLDAQTQAAVAEARLNIAELNSVREVALARVEEKDDAIQEIDQQLAANERKIVEAVESVDGLSDAQVRDRFTKLGF